MLCIAGYAWLAGWIALSRHAGLETQALDMGYADQIAWNTSQGRPFRFTVFTGEAGAHFEREFGDQLAHGPGADRESLLAFHVELAYLPLALLYRLWPGPETLVLLLTTVLALGAVPVYWIARRQLGHPGAALAFALIYLGMPAIQGANVSDFHPVSMAGPLLILALHFLLEGRSAAYVATAVVCLTLKEEVGLAVAMTGLYAWVRGRPRLGASVFFGSVAWVAACVGLIIPHHTGGTASPFLPRYADALQHIAAFPGSLLAGRPSWPLPDHAMQYAAHMLVSSGLLAVLAPLELSIAAPLMAVNALSSSNWQHGGGAHYSSEVAGPLLVATIVGARRALLFADRTLLPTRFGTRLRGVAPIAVAALSLAVAAGQSAAEGVLPPAPRFAWPQPPARVLRARPLLHRIPDDAIVSAQSNLFPHLSRRSRAYVFPTVHDADFVLLDVAGTSAPLGPDALYEHVQQLLVGGRFDLLEAEDGFLLFARKPEHPAPFAQQRTGSSRCAHREEPVRCASFLSLSFLSFARMPPGERFEEARVDFNGWAELVGYKITALPAVNLSERRATVVLYFHAKQETDQTLRLVPFLVGRNGAAREHDVGNSAQLWLPTNRWAPGEVVAVRYPPIAYLRGERLAVGVASDNGWVPVLNPSAPKVVAPSAGPRAGSVTEAAHVAALP